MSDPTITYARSLRALARAASNNGQLVSVEWAPPTAIHIADMIERGAERTRYVAETIKEADALRDKREDELLLAQNANDAADRALARVTEAETAALRFVERVPLNCLCLLATFATSGAFFAGFLVALEVLR